MPSETVRELVYRGFVYRISAESFLSDRQAYYALERLWEICDGQEKWDGRPLVEFKSITIREVERDFENPPLPCKTSVLLPPGSGRTATFDELPLIFAVGEWTGWAADREFPIDLVAFTFVMLTRWEEYVGKTSTDEHGRAVRQDMLAHRFGFDDRPIIDQWAFVLRGWIEAKNPHALSARPESSILMTHDVDRPVKFTGLGRVIRGAIGEMVARSHNPLLAMKEASCGLRALFDYRADPFYIELRRLMDWNEQMGLRGCFYIMTAEPGPFDDGYDASQKPYREILHEIVSRGHEIGWHPGYLTNVDPSVFASEKKRMDQIANGAAVGGRQHYLRWKAGVSWERWEDAGLRYDSSVGFADVIGFRCGTCRPFPVYSLARDQTLRLVERPLVLMDVALELECRSGSDPLDLAKRCLDQVAEVHGEAVMLIHNSFLNRRILDGMMMSIAARKKNLLEARPVIGT